jgi:putative tryptophan/tyrosine transport system substrate-binding protein
MASHIGRRKFLATLGGAAAWPLAARAQQPAMPVVGFLHQGSPEPYAKFTAAFRNGLADAGHVEGRNVVIEYRWAHGESHRLPELAADLVSRRVTVIATPGSIAATLAAKAATAAIPIVFMTGADPVQTGVVASLNRPGGNITGVGSMNVGLGAKQLGLLHELLPGAVRFAVLVNPTNAQSQSVMAEVQTAASSVGAQVEIHTVATNRAINSAFGGVVEKRPDGLLISPDPLFTNRLVQLATLAARHAMPTIFALREFAEAGGLMTYGSNFTDLFRQTGNYTGRVLNGEKPAELPILQATKFAFVINMQTAAALGLEIPPTLLARADEVIE